MYCFAYLTSEFVDWLSMVFMFVVRFDSMSLSVDKVAFESSSGESEDSELSGRVPMEASSSSTSALG